ncbi:hypothetical protein [Streptomyces yaizuensis]|uniref:DUF2007 domain-containing protein n=1 Tax=Streptomyces yaizuensis TaxID=2989713 RepID=A0ABQ5P866_9ACTN|nr:hypothetical protein [Streptomyces sp. YSPA8]GLF98756.1 hypothetical protein SYYSPA8_30685 [Streptomyces sp. YSPA8]
MTIYRQCQDHATAAATALREALAAAGVGADVWRGVGPKVSRFGTAQVEVGCLPAEVAELIAAALRAVPIPGPPD